MRPFRIIILGNQQTGDPTLKIRILYKILRYHKISLKNILLTQILRLLDQLMNNMNSKWAYTIKWFHYILPKCSLWFLCAFVYLFYCVGSEYVRYLLLVLDLFLRVAFVVFFKNWLDCVFWVVAFGDLGWYLLVYFGDAVAAYEVVCESAVVHLFPF